MIISNRIKIIPIPFINSIEENGTILMKKNRESTIMYALNDLDLEERQRRKNGSNYYKQKMRLKIAEKGDNSSLTLYLTMPCIIEITLLNGEVQQWGDSKYPVRAIRKSRGNGDEYTLERTSIAPFLS